MDGVYLNHGRPRVNLLVYYDCQFVLFNTILLCLKVIYSVRESVPTPPSLLNIKLKIIMQIDLK